MAVLDCSGTCTAYGLEDVTAEARVDASLRRSHTAIELSCTAMLGGELS